MIFVDYGLYPPEFNSARMYMGAGSGPMMAAASAWSGLSADLSAVATAYGSVVSALAGGPWTGPSSIAMAAAASPYVGWMHGAAAKAAQTAASAGQAATAYETAFAATVPPPVIAANRAQLAALVATNFLGQNTPAIMATEAQYAEMWAQDAGAMSGYHSVSTAVIGQVSPWAGPLQNTTVGGMAAQHAGVAAANASAAGSQATALPQAMTTPAAAATSGATTGATTATSVPSSATTGSSSSSSSGLSSLLNSGTATQLLTSIGPTGALIGVQGGVYGMMVPTQMMGTFSQMANVARGAGSLVPAVANAAKPMQLMLNGLNGLHGMGGMANGLGAMHPAVSAGMGEANMLGALSVPRAWAGAVPMNPAGMSITGLGGGPIGGVGPGMLGGVPLGAPMNGHAAASGVNAALKLGPRRFTMPRPFAAG